jgi:hypothetical protein
MYIRVWPFSHRKNNFIIISFFANILKKKLLLCVGYLQLFLFFLYILLEGIEQIGRGVCKRYIQKGIPFSLAAVKVFL